MRAQLFRQNHHHLFLAWKCAHIRSTFTHRLWPCAQQAVEWIGKWSARNCKRDQLMLLTNLYKHNFPLEVTWCLMIQCSYAESIGESRHNCNIVHFSLFYLDVFTCNIITGIIMLYFQANSRHVSAIINHLTFFNRENKSWGINPKVDAVRCYN